MHAPVDVHQKGRIPKNVDVFSNALSFFDRDALGLLPSFHLSQCMERGVVRVSGQVRCRLCFFSGEVGNLPD